MTLVVNENQDGTTSIAIDFIDEGVDLQCDTTVKGDEAAAYTYLPFFEKDMRRNFCRSLALTRTNNTTNA